MKKLILVIGILSGLLTFMSKAKAQEASLIPDGLYPVLKVDTTGQVPGETLAETVYLPFSTLMQEPGDIPLNVLLNIADFVPLMLDEPPVEGPIQDDKRHLLLSLSPEASEQLIDFSTRRVNERAAIVIGGEVITMHGIREPLTSGMLQISWCGVDACEILMVRLRDNMQE